MESYCNFEEATPTAINEFISKIVVHERDVKGARCAVQRIEVYFNYIGKFENELTGEIASSEQECQCMREEIDKAKHEKELACPVTWRITKPTAPNTLRNAGNMSA